MLDRILPFLRKSATTKCGLRVPTARKCGHTAHEQESLVVCGTKLKVPRLETKGGDIDYCPACVAAMSIRCAWCKRPIVPPDPVTLYVPMGADFVVPDRAVIYSHDPLQLVGCLRAGCADTGADRAGFWVPGEHGNGHVHRVPSGLELAMQSGESVIVGDAADMDEAYRSADSVAKQISK